MTDVEIITRLVACELPVEDAIRLKIMAAQLQVTQKRLIAMILHRALDHEITKAEKDMLRLTSPFGN